MNASSFDEGRARLQEQLDSRGEVRITLEILTFCALYLIGLVGNFLVLLIAYSKKGNGNMIFLFIGALAFSDMFLLTTSGVFASPLLFLGYWPFPDLVCQFYGFCIVDCAIASLLLVAATAVNRYFKVVRTNYYRNLFTPRRTKLLICGCWLLAALVPTLFLVRGERYHFHPAKILCVQQNRQEGVLTWYVLTWYVYIIVAMCTIVTSYYKIFRTIRRHQTRVNCMQQNTTGPNIQDIKVTRTLFLTVVAFLVCWIPILIIDNIDDSLGLFSLPREVYLFYSWIGAFSSVINPFIYGAMNPAFREEYKKILRIICAGRNMEVEHEVPMRCVSLSGIEG